MHLSVDFCRWTMKGEHLARDSHPSQHPWRLELLVRGRCGGCYPWGVGVLTATAVGLRSNRTLISLTVKHIRQA